VAALPPGGDHIAEAVDLRHAGSEREDLLLVDV
jgi:hypothetical protein